MSSASSSATSIGFSTTDEAVIDQSLITQHDVSFFSDSMTENTFQELSIIESSEDNNDISFGTFIRLYAYNCTLKLFVSEWVGFLQIRHGV